MGLNKGKSDNADAKLIGDYAINNLSKNSPFVPNRDIIQQIRFLYTSLLRLKKCTKLLEANEKCFKYFDKPFYQENYPRTMSSIGLDIENINKEIIQLIDNDNNLKHLYSLLITVPGIGMITFLHLIITTNEFKRFNCPKKYASYCTIAPFRDTSGTSLNRKSPNAHIGNKEMKSV